MEERLKKYFTTYEQVSILEEFGFNEPCLATIDQTEYIHIIGNKMPIRGAMMYDTIKLPLISQVFDWFSDNTSFQGFIEPSIKDGYFDWLILDIDTDERIECSEAYSNRSEAQSACIDKLIELFKNK